MQPFEPADQPWWNLLAWGSVADWIAAIGTVGALFLALLLYMRDHRRLERAHVDELVVWIDEARDGTQSPDGQNFLFLVHVYNASDIPIPVASVQIRSHTGSFVATSRLHPSGHASTVIEGRASFIWDMGSQIDVLKHGRLIVYVRDWRSQVWSKDVFSGKIRRRSNRWVQQRSLLL